MGKVVIRKAVLVSSGQYENVRCEIEIEGSTEFNSETAIRNEADRLTNIANAYLRDEVDAIELKTRKAQSKAGRYGL